MKILVIHQHHIMPGEPGGSRFTEFGRLWSEAGHQVTVVAGTLSYTTGYVPPRYRRRWVTKEREGLLTVYRCHVPATYSRGYRGRMWAFFGFTLSAATAAMLTERPDVVIATSPPLITPIPAWVASWLRWRRIPWIFEIRDLWPESAVTTGVLREGSLLTRSLYALERFACWSASRVNVLTPAFRDNIIERGLAPAEKIVFVPNGADVDLFKPGPRDNQVRRDFGWGDRLVVMYAGVHGRANALTQLVQAAELLRGHEEILIACVGDGPERKALENEAQARGLTNIQFCGPQPKERMPEFVNACDVGVAVLQKNPTFRTVYPNKVFDYMACERPTLLAIDGVARKLVCEDAAAGAFAEPEDPEDIARAILELEANPKARAEMGRSGRAWVLANATRESLAERYLDVMRELVSN